MFAWSVPPPRVLWFGNWLVGARPADTYFCRTFSCSTICCYSFLFRLSSASCALVAFYSSFVFASLPTSVDLMKLKFSISSFYMFCVEFCTLLYSSAPFSAFLLSSIYASSCFSSSTFLKFSEISMPSKLSQLGSLSDSGVLSSDIGAFVHFLFSIGFFDSSMT